jgi:hypothetical protein
VPRATPVCGSSELRFSRHGRPLTVTVAANGPPEQCEYAAVLSDPIPAPGSPLPAWRVPDMREDRQGIVAPVGVSASVILPAVAVIFPPGRTVQVFAAATDAVRGLTARVAAAAGAAVATRAVATRATAARATTPTPVRTRASLRRPVPQTLPAAAVGCAGRFARRLGAAALDDGAGRRAENVARRG